MSEPEGPTPAPAVGSVLGRYQLTRVLGEGGMGTVFEASHLDLGKRAAVKTLHARLAKTAEVRARFMREGQAASRIRHPNVVDVYDVGVEQDHPYLVMELLEGEDMGRLLAHESVLSAQRAADLLLPVVAAVAAAHELGVVHRDLKPDNIFLAVERTQVTPKVLDFGISKLVDREQADALTSTGAFLGTPHYMSPEQAQGAKQLDARSDQYSLGAILYRCTTGRRPIEETSIYALIQRIVRGEFPPPRSLNPDLPRAFETVVLKAMAREPSERFATTRDLGRALLDFASERERALYGPEFSGDGVPAAAVSARGADEVSAFGTTLGDSVQQRDLPGAPRAKRRWVGLIALSAAAVALLLVWRGSSSPVAEAGLQKAAGQSTLSPVPPASVSSTPTATATAASATPLPSASGATPAVSARTIPKPPVKSPRPTLAHDERPTLAPR